MLSGVGGKTIAEAKQSMSWVEFNRWVAYRNKRGSLNPGLRLELVLARFQALWANAKMGKSEFKPSDFTGCIDEPELTIEELLTNWG